MSSKDMTLNVQVRQVGSRCHAQGHGHWNVLLQATKDCLHHIGSFHLYKLRPSVLADLPQNPRKAIYLICEQQINNINDRGEMTQVEDKLLDEFPDLPFGPPYQRYHGAYSKRDSYQHFDSDQLDPLRRFFAKKESTKDIIRKQFLSIGEHSLRRCTTGILRTVVIQGACSTAKCAGCGLSSVLRWNKGDDDVIQWKKIECASCGSFYEVKSIKHLQSRLYTDGTTTIDGGAMFGSYHQIRKHFPERKMFLALIDSSCLTSAHPFWQVHVAATDHAVPSLRPKSFLTSGVSRTCIYTKITIQPATPWYRLKDPQLGDPVAYFRDIIEFVFTEPEPVAANKSDPGLLSFSKMSREELEDHHRGLRRKIARIMILQKK